MMPRRRRRHRQTVECVSSKMMCQPRASEFSHGLGQTRPWGDVGSMSGSPPKAADQASLFDHLVGQREQRRRDGQAERLRGLEIYDQLEFARLYHGQFRGLFASQNATDIDAGFAKRIGST